MPGAIGNIFVRLGLDTATLSTGLKRAQTRLQKSVKRMRSTLSKLSKPIAAISSALGLLGGFSFGALISSTLQSTDALAKHADRLGLSTEALGGLRHAAAITGTSIQGLDIGLQRMVRRVSDAAAGNKGLQKTFSELGLDARQLTQLAPDEQFKRIADAISAIPSQGERVRQTFKIFDTEGVKLKNLLDLGSEGVNQLQQEFVSLGAAISRVDAAKIEIANDSVTRMRTAFSGIGNALTIELAPLLSALADQITQLGQRTGGFRNIIIRVIEIATRGIGFIANGVQGLRLAFRGAQVVVARLGQGFISLGQAYLQVHTFLLSRIADGIAAFSKFRTSVQQSFVQMVNAVVKSIVSVINRMIQLVTEGAEKAVNKVIGAFNSIAAFVGQEGLNTVSLQAASISAPPISLDGLIDLDSQVLGLAEEATRKLAGLTNQGQQTLGVLKDGFAEVADGYTAEVDRLLDQRLASDVIDDWLADVKEKTQEAANTIATTATQQTQAINNIAQGASNAANKAAGEAKRAASAVKRGQSEIEGLLNRAKELLTTDAQRLAQEIAGWKRLLDIGKITQKQFDTLVQKSKERFSDLQDSVQGVTERMGNALDEFIDNGTFSFKGFVDSLLRDIARVQLKLLTKNLFGSFGGSGGGLGSILSGVGSLFGFGGARENGGPVTAGTSFLVGERGPELFVPNRSGTIIPNDALQSTQASRTVVLQESITVNPGVSREELRITLEEVERQRDEKQRRLIETGEAVFAGFVEA